jgi:exodeoxyribonuclease VII small subunit
MERLRRGKNRCGEGMRQSHRREGSGSVNPAAHRVRAAEAMADEQGPEEGKQDDLASFEEDLKRLEEIVSSLEEGDLELDKSLGLYREGIGAYQRCRKMLDEAELKVKRLVESLEGELAEEPFELPEE